MEPNHQLFGHYLRQRMERQKRMTGRNDINTCAPEKSPKRYSEQVGVWRWVALILVSMAIFMDALDVSIVNIALPNIQRGLQLTTTDLQWIQGVYILTYAGLQLLGGRAADLLGRRRIFLLGTMVFGVASGLGGLASSGWLLILARGLQGIGAAFTAPAAVSIITTTFPEGPERNKALGIFSATGGMGFTCGLILGGVLTNFISWHWVFFVNVPFVLLILLVARFVVQEGRSTANGQSYDLAGAVTVTGGLLLLVYAVTQANQPGATPGRTAGLLVAALLILVIFVAIERYSKAPLMPLRIFRSGAVSAASIVMFALLGSFFSFLFICTLYLQNVLHYSPVMASLALLPGSIITIPFTQFVAPWLMNRLGMRLSTILGMFCLLSGALLFMGIGVSADYVGIILPATTLAQIGMGICIPTLSVAVVSGIVPAEQGLVSGLQGTLGQAGGGLWLAITSAVVAAVTFSGYGGATKIVPSTLAQLSGFQAGLLVVAAAAALGALVAFLGIRRRPEIPLNAAVQEQHAEVCPSV